MQSAELGRTWPQFSHLGVRGLALGSSDHLPPVQWAWESWPLGLPGWLEARAYLSGFLLFLSFLFGKMGLAQGPGAGCCGSFCPLCS